MRAKRNDNIGPGEREHILPRFPGPVFQSLSLDSALFHAIILICIRSTRYLGRRANTMSYPSLP